MTLQPLRVPALYLLAALAASLTNAQSLLNRADAEKINRVLAHGNFGDALKCTAAPIGPFLDFAFRFEAGYAVSCPVKEFDGRQSMLISYLQVTPANAPAVVFAQRYDLPSISPEMAKQTQIRKLKTSYETSGGFALGQGEFNVQLLLIDNRNRFFLKKWTIKAHRSGHEKPIQLSIPAQTVTTLPSFVWDGKSAGNCVAGSRLTVLLDAAPISPYATRLRAWDRSFLLGALSSLLRETPVESVRLIAFNLDQQRIIFQQDHFDGSGFQALSQALEQLELGTVSYKALQKNGWAELLARLINSEITATEPADAVVFLGPTTRYTEKVPPTMLLPRKNSSPELFYLEYFPVWRIGREFPDAIHYATGAYKGTVLKIHSPAELSDAMRKLNQRTQFSHAPAQPGAPWRLVRETSLSPHSP